MQIRVLPNDLIVRCCWDSYVYYVLGSDKNAEQLLKENKEFEISERDALVIGLLKVIETPNLIHKFNTHIVELLANKSINQGKDVIVRKKALESSVDKFLDKFPDYWIPNAEYKSSLTDLVDYIEVFKIGLEKIEVIKVTDQFGTHEYINSNNVKKILHFSY